MTLKQFEYDLPPNVAPLSPAGQLYFPRHETNTIPIRVVPGHAPSIKPDFIDRLPIVTQVHSDIFDLTDPVQKQWYEQIKNAIQNRWFLLLGEPSFHWCREKGKLKRYVHIEYVYRERTLDTRESQL
jgi:hypothetical protein